MVIFENFLSQIQSVFKNGVFGLSLGELGFILVAFILALLIRGLIAKFIVNKVKLIVLKTTTSIDDKLFDSLIPQTSRTATDPKKIIKYLSDLIIHKT